MLPLLGDPVPAPLLAGKDSRGRVRFGQRRERTPASSPLKGCLVADGAENGAATWLPGMPRSLPSTDTDAQFGASALGGEVPRNPWPLDVVDMQNG
jgi:hypothetical protein